MLILVSTGNAKRRAAATPHASHSIIIRNRHGVELSVQFQISFSYGARAIKHDLKRGLKGLPRPKNDYEIVAPEEDAESDVSGHSDVWIEDAAEVDDRTKELMRQKSEDYCGFRRHYDKTSLILQRALKCV